MPIRNAEAFTFKAAGVSDAIDGTNAPGGAMAALQNLIPLPSTKGVFCCRPAATTLKDFSSFTAATQITAMAAVGSRIYGMVSSGRFAGKDEPFCYDVAANAFIAVQGCTNNNCPTSPASSGDWTPPCVAAITSTKVVVTHPGFPGTNSRFFGVFDTSSFSYTGSITTNSTTTITSTTNLIAAGVQPGQTITKADIPAGTTIVSIASGGLSATISASATGSTTSSATIAGGTPAAPLWMAVNTNLNPLSAVPVSVAQFNGRAWFAVGNSVVYTDALVPTSVTNASQALIVGDNQTVTCLFGVPLESPISGGVVQSLTAFKGAAAFWQITGDQATSNLALNQVNGSVGTVAPNTVCTTPLGTAFVAPDGVRILGLNGQVANPIGAYGDGVCVPFLNPVAPTRMCAAFNNNVLRITVQNSQAVGQPFQEYWYDFSLEVWTGPHTSAFNLIVPQYGSPTGFIGALQGAPVVLSGSSVVPSSGSSYTENGAALTWVWQTCLMPDSQDNQMSCLVQSSVSMAFGAAQTVVATPYDDNGVQLDTITLTGGSQSSSASTVWGSFTWGAAVWGQTKGLFKQFPMNWNVPLVFKQMTLTMTGQSTNAFAVGNLYGKIRRLGYMLQGPVNP